MPASRLILSLVIPLYNEHENVASLIEGIVIAFDEAGIEHYEVILVDDGSNDGTAQQVREHMREGVRLVQLSRNYGQTSALAAGIDAAHGDYIALMDGDLQHEPRDIGRLLHHAREHGLDVVAGYREQRKDATLSRIIPSRLANWLIRTLTKVHVKDYGCTLKIFKAEMAKRLELYGELHRFLPILSVMAGARMEQLPVTHYARKFGRSKYGLRRSVHVLSDLLLMLFFMRYRERPMHFFGGLGIGFGMIGSVMGVYLLVQKIMGHDIGDRPLFYVALLMIFMAVQCVTTGFLSELVMRSYYASRGKKPYHIVSDVDE